MSEIIFWILETEITGDLDSLKSLMNEMSDFTKSGEPDALNYEWFISEDNKYCTLFERYKDSTAALIHVNSFMKNFAGRFMSLLKPKKFAVYGNPDAELKKMLDNMKAVHNPILGGFLR